MFVVGRNSRMVKIDRGSEVKDSMQFSNCFVFELCHIMWKLIIAGNNFFFVKKNLQVLKNSGLGFMVGQIFLLYKTNTFHFVLGLFSYRSLVIEDAAIWLEHQ